ncbi:MAG: hypothetical protein QOE81_1671 [Verrucomicrobiota bacterium]
MDERARRLNQSFEKIIVVGVAIEPNLLQNVVRLVVALVVPTAEVGAVEWMVRHVAGRSPECFRGQVGIVALQLAHKLRNPLAFAHGGLNFIVPQMMGKLTFPEGHESVRDRSQE